MDIETEEQRRARQDGAQLAFSATLRELVRDKFPNEQVRASRRDKLKRGMETVQAEDDLDMQSRASLDAAIAAIDSIFSSGRG